MILTRHFQGNIIQLEEINFQKSNKISSEINNKFDLAGDLKGDFRLPDVEIKYIFIVLQTKENFYENEMVRKIAISENKKLIATIY